MTLARTMFSKKQAVMPVGEGAAASGASPAGATPFDDESFDESKVCSEGEGGYAQGWRTGRGLGIGRWAHELNDPVRRTVRPRANCRNDPRSLQAVTREARNVAPQDSQVGRESGGSTAGRDRGLEGWARKVGEWVGGREREKERWAGGGRRGGREGRGPEGGRTGRRGMGSGRAGEEGKT